MPSAAVLKVLVVDDQNSVRQMTRITLEQIGIRHIHEAENGRLRHGHGVAAAARSDHFRLQHAGDGRSCLVASGPWPSGGAQNPVHPADRARRSRARRQGGAGGCEQLSDQAVHSRHLAAKNRAGDGEIVVMAVVKYRVLQFNLLSPKSARFLLPRLRCCVKRSGAFEKRTAASPKT